MPSKKSIEAGPKLQSEDAFLYNVAVPFDPTCYDSKTIQSMVKLVNRTGRVRWVGVDEDGDEWCWHLVDDPIDGIDYLEDFLSNILDVKLFYDRDTIFDLVVSFEVQTEARAFRRDLDALLSSADPKRKRPLSPVEESQKLKREKAKERKREEAERQAKIDAMSPEERKAHDAYWARVNNVLAQATKELKEEARLHELRLQRRLEN